MNSLPNTSQLDVVRDALDAARLRAGAVSALVLRSITDVSHIEALRALVHLLCRETRNSAWNAVLPLLASHTRSTITLPPPPPPRFTSLRPDTGFQPLSTSPSTLHLTTTRLPSPLTNLVHACERDRPYLGLTQCTNTIQDRVSSPAVEDIVTNPLTLLTSDDARMALNSRTMRHACTEARRAWAIRSTYVA